MVLRRRVATHQVLLLLLLLLLLLQLVPIPLLLLLQIEQRKLEGARVEAGTVGESIGADQCTAASYMRHQASATLCASNEVNLFEFVPVFGATAISWEEAHDDSSRAVSAKQEAHVSPCSKPIESARQRQAYMSQCVPDGKPLLALGPVAGGAGHSGS